VTGPKRVSHKTRRHRRLRDNLKKAGIWVFIVVFVSSVVGVAVVTIAR
jgi:hypothetical protein